MTTKMILVVLDPTSDEQAAVERAAWLADRLSARLELFFCDYDADIDAGRVSTVWMDKPAALDNLLAIQRGKLEAIAATLRERGLEVDVDIAWDHPLDEGIVRKVLACKPWLVAKDTHHHNLLKRTILSNTDWQLIRNCPAPLLLVKPDTDIENPRIFAAVDPLHAHDKEAQLDNDIVNFAKSLADGTGGELHVFHSYFVPITAGFANAALITQLTDETEKLHRDGFNEFLAQYAIPEDRTHLLAGAPQDVLPEIAATENAGLIVMGAVSRSGRDRVFIGSTAERVLDRLPCDLLIVKAQRIE